MFSRCREINEVFIYKEKPKLNQKVNYNFCRKFTMDNLNLSLIKDSINYHGPQLQKFFELEFGELNPKLVQQIDYQREKYLSNSDCEKRFKIQQFIAKKANFLFKTIDFHSLSQLSESKPNILNLNIEKTVAFDNPDFFNYSLDYFGLNKKKELTLMANVKTGYQDNDYELRPAQASKRATRLVADGIEHFKAGRHTEAFNCLTSALQIDPNNVEGLVAHGALYANGGNYEKAISDFETALKLNQNHGNARKYLGETLVAYGRILEDEKKFDDAKGMYLHCLALIPTHEEAKMSLDYLKNRLSMEALEQNVVIETDSLLPPNFASLPRPKLNQEFHNSKTSAAPAVYVEKSDIRKKKNKKGKKRKHRARSTSSSSSSSSSRSSSSSSSSSSKSSSSSSDESEYKRKRKKASKSRKHDRKNASPSPFTKKIEEFSNLSQYAKSSKDIDYELKVRAFLEQTKNSPNFEDHVRKFLLESAKLKQQQQSQLKQLHRESPIIEKKKHKKHKHDKKKRDKDGKRKKKNEDKSKKDSSDPSKKKSSKSIFDLHHETSKKLLESMDSYEDFESKLSALHTVAQKKNDLQSSQEKHEIKKTSSMDMSELQKGRYQRNSEQKHSEEHEPNHEKSKKSERNELILQGLRLKNTPSTSLNASALQTNTSSNIKSVPQPVILDKFGNFRLITEKDVPENILVQDRLLNEKSKKEDKRISRSKSHSRSRSRSRSHSRKRRDHSSSSSKSRRSRRSRSRGRSSRSASRSYSHSRSRSRSSSGEHHNYRNRRAVRGNWHDRGTYYKPRYYNNYNNRGRGNQMNNRNYRGGGGWGGRPYNNRNYRNNNNSIWTYRANNNNRNNRRHAHSYSKSHSRSKSVSAGSNWSDEQNSTMRKVNEEKDKINKILDNENKSTTSAEQNSKDKVSDHEGNELFV